MPPLFSLRCLTEWILFHEYSTGCSTARYYIVSVLQMPVPSECLHKPHPQHLGVNRLQALRDRILRSLDQGWAHCSYLLSLLAVHPQCFNKTTTVQRVLRR